MTLGLAFWVIVLVAVVFGVLSHFGIVGGGGLAVLVGPIVLLILIILLGWQVFGPPLRR